MIRVQSLVSYDSGGEAGQLLLQSEPGVGGRTRSTCYIGSRLTWKSSPEMWPFSWSSWDSSLQCGRPWHKAGYWRQGRTVPSGPLHKPPQCNNVIWPRPHQIFNYYEYYYYILESSAPLQGLLSSSWTKDEIAVTICLMFFSEVWLLKVNGVQINRQQKWFRHNQLK